MARFVNLDRFFDPQQAEMMGEQAIAGVNPALNAADISLGSVRGGLENDSAAAAQSNVNAAQQKLAMANSTSGLQGLIGGAANPMDAWMASQSQAVGNVRKRYGDLDKQLKGAQYQGQMANEQQAVQAQQALDRQAYEQRQNADMMAQRERDRLAQERQREEQNQPHRLSRQYRGRDVV